MNSLFNVVKYEPNIDKIYLYAKDSYEANFKVLTKKWESRGLKHLKDSKAFIDHWNDMYDIYKNVEEYNSNKKCNVLIVFDDMIGDILSKKI